MVEYLCRHAWDTTTPVVCSFSAPDLQDPVYLFFAGLENFSVSPEDGMICKVPLSEIPRSRLAALRNNSVQIRPFFSLPAVTRRQFLLQLEQQHALLWDNFDGQDCCQPLCLCATDGANIHAAAFVTNDGADLDLSFVWCAAGCHRQLMALLAQISSLYRRAAAICGLLPSRRFRFPLLISCCRTGRYWQDTIRRHGICSYKEDAACLTR